MNGPLLLEIYLVLAGTLSLLFTYLGLTLAALVLAHAAIHSALATADCALHRADNSAELLRDLRDFALPPLRAALIAPVLPAWLGWRLARRAISCRPLLKGKSA